MSDRASRLRFWLLQVLIVGAFALLGVRLWDLQIISEAEYRQSADENSYRLLPVDAQRGVIYDRNGQMLVRNVPSFTVNIVPADLPEQDDERERVLERVGELIGLPATDQAVAQATTGDEETPVSIETLLRWRTVNVNLPVCVATDVDRQAAFVIEEEHLDLPGISVGVAPLREYTYGPLVSHILGYVGRIPNEYANTYTDDPDADYDLDDLVGLAGVERAMEDTLRGTKGNKHVQVDAYGREITTIAEEAPSSGSSLMLTLDLSLQEIVQNALLEGMANAGSEVGVCIAMDPRTGEILALGSLPSYDNNLFSGGISHEDYGLLSTDSNRPLVNHAVSGQYPPGSTFKIVPAAAALEWGVVSPYTTFTCQGRLYLPNKYAPDDPSLAQTFYCWSKTGHGTLNLVGALMQSCDIYFYQVAGGYGDFQGLGIDRLGQAAELFGFGEPTGIELPAEASGLVPSDEWKRHTYDETWLTGDTYNAAIGQGFVLATPLQVLNATAAVANGGTLYRPQLIYQTIGGDGAVTHVLTPEPIHDLSMSPDTIELVRQGLLEAVEYGTGYYAKIPGLAVAGKTGTAEFARLDDEGNLILDHEGNLPTHAWFTAFAPYEDPEIALVVFLDDGGEGSQTAAPVAAKVLRYYFGIDEPDIPQN